jgi:hypothetical protein
MESPLAGRQDLRGRSAAPERACLVALAISAKPHVWGSTEVPVGATPSTGSSNARAPGSCRRPPDPRRGTRSDARRGKGTVVSDGARRRSDCPDLPLGHRMSRSRRTGRLRARCLTDIANQSSREPGSQNVFPPTDLITGADGAVSVEATMSDSAAAIAASRSLVAC